MNKKKLYLLAEQKGMKISFIISKSGVSRKSFYSYMNTDVKPSSDVLLNIANTLGVTIDAIKK